MADKLPGKRAVIDGFRSLRNREGSRSRAQRGGLVLNIIIANIINYLPLDAILSHLQIKKCKYKISPLKIAQLVEKKQQGLNLGRLAPEKMFLITLSN